MKYYIIVIEKRNLNVVYVCLYDTDENRKECWKDILLQKYDDDYSIQFFDDIA